MTLKAVHVTFDSIFNQQDNLDSRSLCNRQEREMVSQISPIRSCNRASMRRLRSENRAMLKADRPAADLQAVYDKFYNRPCNPRNYGTMELHFVATGDIDSLKVLMKYGLNIKNESYLTIALMESQHSMIRFLVANGTPINMNTWITQAIEMRNDKIRRFERNSPEWASTFEYLLSYIPDNQINTGLRNGPTPLRAVLNAGHYCPSEADQLHKDRLIKLLLERGARLDP